MITSEYKGLASQWSGIGDVHEVHVFWNSTRDPEGGVERAASKAVREVVGKGGSVTFDSWDVDTYKSPSLAAIVRVRVLTDEQVTARKELKARRYTVCAVCDNAPPGEIVRLLEDGTEHPMCYSCRRGLQGPHQVIHWIKANGIIQVN